MKNGTQISLKLRKDYKIIGKFAVGNNKNINMDYRNQFYFYFGFLNFRVGRARKTTNQIGLALGVKFTN